MQSLSGHYLMRQQVPMVFLLVLVYLGTVAYISVEISLGSFLVQGYFKGQRSSIIHKLQLLMTLCAWRDMQLLSGHYLMRHQLSTHGVFTSLVYLSAVAYISVEISLGLLLMRGYFKGQRSRIYRKLQTFYDFV